MTENNNDDGEFMQSALSKLFVGSFEAKTDLNSVVIYPSFRSGENIMKVYFRAHVKEMDCGWKENGEPDDDNNMTGKIILSGFI